METTDADTCSWSDMAQSCVIDLWVMKWRSAWPIFHGPVISPYISRWRLFDVCTSYFGVMNQYDPRFDLKINIGHCDLYFMVHWFCLVPWRLFDVWTSLFGIMNQYHPKFDLKINVGHCDLYFMVQWFCIISWRLMYEHHMLGLWVSITRHLILPCILNTLMYEHHYLGLGFSMTWHLT